MCGSERKPDGGELQLKDAVATYLSVAGAYGRVIPLALLGLDRAQLENTFSVLDEDYHISRYFHFSSAVGASGYAINGVRFSHISVDEQVQTIL